MVIVMYKHRITNILKTYSKGERSYNQIGENGGMGTVPVEFRDW